MRSNWVVAIFLIICFIAVLLFLLISRASSAEAKLRGDKCLVDVNNYVELITTTDNYQPLEIIRGVDAKALKRSIDETPPRMLKVEAMTIDRIDVMRNSDIPLGAYLLYSDKGCLKAVMGILAPLYVRLRLKIKQQPNL